MRKTITVLSSPPALHEDLIAAIEFRQNDYTEKEFKHGAYVRGVLTFAADFTIQLRSSDVELGKFLEHAFWTEKPHKANPDRLPLLVMQFIYGVAKSGGAKYERARKHSKIVKWYLDRNYTADAMRNELKKKALDDVEDQIENEQGSGGSPDPSDDVTDSLNEENHDDRYKSVATGREGSDVPSSPATVRNHGQAKPRPPRYPFDTLREIAIEAEPAKIDSLRRLSDGDSILIRLKRKPDDGYWAKFEAVSIVRPRGR